MRIIFYCTTCDIYNRSELGMPNYDERQVEYSSFTEAYNHLMEHNTEHNIEARIEEEKE